MEKTFKCAECGTKYSTPSNIPPPSPNWADGHVCIMMELKDNTESIKFRQPGKQIGSMLASYVSNSTPLQTDSPIINYDEDVSEARMRIIAQNGNTGEHYREEDDTNG